MNEITNYDKAVEIIKTAILQSQYDAARSVNEKQLMLYYGIGKYISLNSRKGFWGKGAIDAISKKLDKELPGLRGFTSRNLRYMRTFYEEWEMLDFIDQLEKTSDNKSNGLELTNSELEITAIVPMKIFTTRAVCQTTSYGRFRRRSRLSAPSTHSKTLGTVLVVLFL